MVITADTFAENSRLPDVRLPEDLEMLRQQGCPGRLARQCGGTRRDPLLNTRCGSRRVRPSQDPRHHGDLALVGSPIIGHVVAHRGGHALHTALGTALLERRDAWTYVEAPQSATDLVGVPVTVAS